MDALRTLKISVGIVAPTLLDRIAADVDVLDALRILKASVGLVDITSCGGPQ